MDFPSQLIDISGKVITVLPDAMLYRQRLSKTLIPKPWIQATSSQTFAYSQTLTDLPRSLPPIYEHCNGGVLDRFVTLTRPNQL